MAELTHVDHRGFGQLFDEYSEVRYPCGEAFVDVAGELCGIF